MNKTLKDLWKDNKNAKKKTIPPVILALDPKYQFFGCMQLSQKSKTKFKT
jgi:hypothetical protein